MRVPRNFKKYYFSVVSLLLLLAVGVKAPAQQTKVYTDKYKSFKDGLELFDKAQYQSAQVKFNETSKLIGDSQDEISIDAEYYGAICALELFNQDAEYLLNKFAYDHPDNVRAKTVLFQLGNHHFKRKRYRDAIKYYDKVDPLDLSEKERIEYNFKTGYSAFYTKDYAKAKVHFYEVKDLETEYKVPSTYYFSHIAYMDGDNQVALNGFRSIDADPNFKTIVPYYIGQILYKQKKYEELIEYGPLHYESISSNRKPEFAHIIGDSYYKMQDYEAAVPYLEAYNKKAKSSREDNYQMGYTYYRVGKYDEAIIYLRKVKSKKDALAQIAYYQLADSYIKTSQKEYARNAFKAASEMDFDKEIEEDALWSYAKLAYELSYNPYDEAIEAFHTYLERYPNSKNKDQAYEYLLNVYTTTKNYDAALESIERIKNKNTRLKKAYQQITYNRGVEKFHNKEYENAIADFNKVKDYPVDKILNSMSIYWKGEANYAMQYFSKAVLNYTAFKNEPGAVLTEFKPMADYNLGYSYLRKENYTSSITAFRKYLSYSNNADLERKGDAFLRLADNYYLLKEDNQAIFNYESAIDLGIDNADYAYYQMARSFGYKSEYENEIKALKSVIEKYPNSIYHVPSVYQLGDSYLKAEDYSNALIYFKEIVEEHPENGNARKALYNTGLIYFRQGKYKYAEDIFNQVVDDYPNSEEKNSAVDAMKDVYITQDKLTQYAAWLNSKGIDHSTTDLDNEFYKLAIDETEKSPRDCNRVIEKWSDYLENVNTPQHKVPADYYIASCSHKLERFEDALTNYNKVIASPNNEFSERSLYYASQLNYFKFKDYQGALSNLATLEKVAQNAEFYNWSIEGQMRTFFKLENYQFAKEYARKVLNKIKDNEDLEVDAQYIEAISLKELKEYSSALIALKKTTELTKSAKGAEAKYWIAEIYFEQNNYEEAEATVQELVKQKPGYDYWLAKGIILLSDIYVATEDYFNARYSLESVVNGYEGDDDLVQIAQQKLIALDALENATPEEDDEVEEEIDLNNDGND